MFFFLSLFLLRRLLLLFCPSKPARRRRRRDGVAGVDLLFSLSLWDAGKERKEGTVARRKQRKLLPSPFLFSNEKKKMRQSKALSIVCFSSAIDAAPRGSVLPVSESIAPPYHPQSLEKAKEMASKLSSLCAGVAARREALCKKRPFFSSAASASAFSPRPPRPLSPPLLPTDAAALSLAHGPSAPALVDSLTGRVTTFSGLAETARATAEALRLRVDFSEQERKNRNVDPETGARASGPRVAVLGRPSPGFAAALWGVWASGGCAVPLHHALPERAMAASLADVGASAILFANPDDDDAEI